MTELKYSNVSLLDYIIHNFTFTNSQAHMYMLFFEDSRLHRDIRVAKTEEAKQQMVSRHQFSLFISQLTGSLDRTHARSLTYSIK